MENGEEAKMISLEKDKLTFRYPEVHERAEFSIDFQRTLRIPDDERLHPLPRGLGKFPLRHVEDFPQKLPPVWLNRGGVVMPMYQSEAMWLSFNSTGYPFAIKVATGKINVITGEAWRNNLNMDPQDYMIIPEQPWLDGYCVDKGVIRQFVACSLGENYTAEEQITGAAEFGGVQIIAYPMKADRYEKIIKKRKRARKREAYGDLLDEIIKRRKLVDKILNGIAKEAKARTGEVKVDIQELMKDFDDEFESKCGDLGNWAHNLGDELHQIVEEGIGDLAGVLKDLGELLARFEEGADQKLLEIQSSHSALSTKKVSMGLAPGGQMSQEIFEDYYMLDAWDQRNASRCFIHLSNSAVWRAITDEEPPTKPLTAQDYSKAGLPWFDYYDFKNESVEGAKILADLKSVIQMADYKGDEAIQDIGPIIIDRVKVLKP
jgi:hypothetical protein